MRLAQEHIFAQARNDAHSILVDWDNGVITAQEAYNDIIKLKDAGTGYKTVPRYDINNPHPFGTLFNDPLERKLVDYLTGMDIVMADPLPHPSEDKPQRPNPNQEPSSPYLPGKSPVPSRDDKLAGIPPGGWTIDGAGSGMGGMTPEDIERLQEGNPGAAEKIKKLYKKKQQKTGLPDFLVELNPAQIKVLEKLKGVDKLPDAERLQRMREITDEVNKAKGLA